MKPKMSFAWFMVAMATAALLLVKWETVREQHREIELLETHLHTQDLQRKAIGARLLALERENLALRHKLHNARLDMEKVASTTADNPNGAAAGRQSSDSLPSGPRGFGSPMVAFGKMLEDPEMRALFAETQQQALKQMYEPLVKKLNLTDAERTEFLRLLGAQATNQMATAGSLMAQAPGSPEFNSAAKAIEEEQQGLESRIVELLGPDRAAQYKDYTLTLGDRTLMAPYFASSGMDQDQAEALLSLFAEERKAVATAPEFSLDGPASAADPAWAEFMLQTQETIYKRVLDRSQAILSHEQYTSLAAFQTNMLNQQRLGLKMAEQFLGKDSAPEPKSEP